MYHTWTPLMTHINALLQAVHANHLMARGDASSQTPSANVSTASSPAGSLAADPGAGVGPGAAQQAAAQLASRVDARLLAKTRLLAPLRCLAEAWLQHTSLLLFKFSQHEVRAAGPGSRCTSYGSCKYTSTSPTGT